MQKKPFCPDPMVAILENLSDGFSRTTSRAVNRHRPIRLSEFPNLLMPRSCRSRPTAEGRIGTISGLAGSGVDRTILHMMRREEPSETRPTRLRKPNLRHLHSA